MDCDVFIQKIYVRFPNAISPVYYPRPIYMTI